MASTAQANRKKAAPPEPTPEQAARIAEGANMLAIGRIMAGFTDGTGTPERQYLYGFYAGVVHGLQVAALDADAGARWLAWMLEVVHKGRPDNAEQVALHARRLIETAPS